jgi:glycosyltransferase involved in cell wall biosynthesis
VKLVHLVDSLDVGGAEVLVAQLCRQQLRRGDRPFVHCFLRKGLIGEKLQDEGIEVSVSRPGRVARYLDLWRVLRRVRPDVVHCHNANAAINGAPPARLAGVKTIVVTRHGLVPPDVKVVREKRFWFAARFCDRVVAVCDAAARNLERGPGAIPGKIVTIRNGTAPPPRGTEQRPAKSGFTVITVARLAREKDHRTLLRALALARAQVPDLQAWIVGDGPLRPELEALIRELGLDGCAHLQGERPDAGRWLEAADLFVLSSISEGLPVSVLEAMAAGLPLLLTRVGGMPEIVELTQGGRIVDASDPAALAGAMVEMAVDRERLRVWGDANRAVYTRELTGERMCDSYSRLYTALKR